MAEVLVPKSFNSIVDMRPDRCSNCIVAIILALRFGKAIDTQELPLSEAIADLGGSCQPDAEPGVSDTECGTLISGVTPGELAFAEAMLATRQPANNTPYSKRLTIHMRRLDG